VLCADWQGNTPDVLATNWIKGGKMTIKRIYPDPKTGKFDMLGTKGVFNCGSIQALRGNQRPGQYLRTC